MPHSPSPWADTLKAVYAQRAANSQLVDKYAALAPATQQMQQERERTLGALLRRHLSVSVDQANVLEIGCGNGANLLDFIRLGFDPARLRGNDIIESRAATARQRLPASTRVDDGDALQLAIPPESQDIVLQSTVFTSLLQDEVRSALASQMWRWVKPGGGVLWYDFTYNNPRNPHVRGVPLRALRALFPAGRIDARRVTLAPPLARRIPSALYTPTNLLLPMLRTHLYCWIAKPA